MPKSTVAFVSVLIFVAIAHVVASAPEPLSFWTFQEASGLPKTSSGVFNYTLTDSDPSNPILRASDGLFGPYSAEFQATTPSQRLRADRTAVPGLTIDIAGPNAVVSMVAWIKRTNMSAPFSKGFLAGVWGDTAIEARQYAMYFDLGMCYSAPIYNEGFAAHVSPTGGPTPGHQFCVTGACDPRSLGANDWHCVTHTYDGANIRAYVNATLSQNGDFNPFPLVGGIYSPEKAGKPGAEFGVGVSMSFGDNQYQGLLAGLAVFNVTLSVDEVAEVCAWPGAFKARK